MRNLQAIQVIPMSRQGQQGQEVPCRRAGRSCQELLVCQVDPPLPSLLGHQGVQVAPGVRWVLNRIFIKDVLNFFIISKYFTWRTFFPSGSSISSLPLRTRSASGSNRSSGSRQTRHASVSRWSTGARRSRGTQSSIRPCGSLHSLQSRHSSVSWRSPAARWTSGSIRTLRARHSSCTRRTLSSSFTLKVVFPLYV